MKTERLEAADVTQIYKLWNEYSEAINSEKLDQWIALWGTDGILMPPNSPQRFGTEEIQKSMQSQFDQFHVKFSINPEVVRVLGDHAYTHGSFISTLTPTNAESKVAIQRSGKFLTILEKRADTSWKILVNCYNYNEPE